MFFGRTLSLSATTFSIILYMPMLFSAATVGGGAAGGGGKPVFVLFMFAPDFCVELGFVLFCTRCYIVLYFALHLSR